MSKQDEMKEARRLWLAELRSGKHKQGRSKLHRINEGDRSKDQYCCLGIACLAFKKSGGELREKETLGCVVYDGVDAILPPQVGDWLGLRTNAGTFSDGAGVANTLWQLNDSGKGFFQIADIIESEPEGLFVSEPQ